MYAVIQEINGSTSVCGSNLFYDLESAKVAYTQIATAYYNENAFYNESYVPKLIDLKTDNIIYPKKDLRDELRANDDVLYNKAKELTDKYILDLKSKLLF
jgi:hypothetical protein